ncbi:MAG: heavy metal translocating P-type ATPase [Lachnospiraceae bacterium]|nr:heavy metal translocating P-type ATPase [Lachnospiraceae bacterium]
MNKKQKKVLKRIIISIVLLVALQILLHFTEVPVLLQFALYMIPYIVIGGDILKKAFHGITHGQVFDECFLMAVATVGAIILGLVTEGEEGGFLEGVAVMLFYQIGELFQSVAVGKSRKNITDLMDIRPDYANIETESGELEKADPEDVAIGQIIVVKAGEKIPIDGIIREGTASLDTSALTGESMPVDKTVGDEVISGCVNITGLLKIETTREFGESTVSKILDMVENSSMKKSKSENFISKFARYYTPIVCYLALALALLPPIGLLLISSEPMWGTWVIRALTFLVISCPCALVISIPLSFFGGIGAASSNGILVKGSNYLEALSETGIIAFDKTGTLTKGTFEVTKVVPAEGFSADDLVIYASLAERYSDHPIALSIKKFAEENGLNSIEELIEDENIPGKGVRVRTVSNEIHAGNSALMESIGFTPISGVDYPGTVIHVACDRNYVGMILISDSLKPTSKKAIEALKASGIRRLVMLTGDRKESAENIAGELGLTEYRAGLLPGDKVDEVEKLISDKKGKEKLAFVGDGINDAPVLSRADIGIAMGALGSDAAIESADIVLMDDDPARIALAMKISKKCLRIVRENIIFAIGIKVLCLILGAFGIANMWMAIFADVGVMVIAVLNAIRCLKIPQNA